MDEKKQITQTGPETVTPTRFWGTLALAGILLAVGVYFFIVLFQQPNLPVIYIAMATFLVVIVSAVISIILVLRHAQETGLRFAFYTLLLIGLAAALLFQGRAIIASLAILVISAITIWWLIPRQSWRRYSILAAAAIGLMWIIEWINPPWRTQLAAATIGPIAAAIFGVILMIVLVAQAWRGNLRLKLITAFLAVTLIPLTVVFLLNNTSTSQILTNSSDAALQSTAAQTAAAIDTFMSERINDVRVESQKHIFSEYLSLPGTERAGSETEAAVSTDLLSIARRDQTFITSVGLLDKNGLSVADTVPSEVGVDKSQRNYFIGARDSLLPYASPVEISATTGQLSIYFTAPVRDKNDNFIGVLRIRYNATVFQSILNRTADKSNLNSVALVLLDENHIRLADNSLPEYILKSVIPLPADTTAKLLAERRLDANKPAAELSTNIPDFEAGLNNLDQQPIFLAEFHQLGAGNPEEGAASRLQNVPWVVAAGQDRNIFLAPLNQQTNNNLLLALVIAAFVALVAFAVAQTIANPVVRLTRVAQQVSGGDINVQAKVESRDEIGTLASTFNTMTAQLRDLIASLEVRVADRTKALATSTEVSRRLSTILNQKELVSEVVNQVREAFGYYHAQIYFFDESGENLVMAGGTGEVGRMMLAQFHKVAQGRGLVGRAAEGNRPVLVSDTRKDPDWLPNPLLPDTESEVAIPITIGEQVLGVLDVQHNIKDGLQQEDIGALEAIANQVAIATQNIRQYETTQKIASDMAVVANVGIATSTITNATLLLQEVVDLSKKSFNLYHAHIYLMNEAGNSLQLAAGAGEVGRQMVSEGRHIALDSEKSLVARAARSGIGVVVNDVTLDPEFLPNPLLPETRSEMAVPMLVAGKTIGVLDVQSETVNRFTEIDVNIKTTLASQIAIAVQNARSFAQAQQQATHETTLNLITQKIQSATTIEAALKIAARELGHAVGMKPTRVALNPEALGESRVEAALPNSLQNEAEKMEKSNE